MDKTPSEFEHEIEEALRSAQDLILYIRNNVDGASDAPKNNIVLLAKKGVHVEQVSAMLNDASVRVSAALSGIEKRARSRVFMQRRVRPRNPL